jgi:ribosomal peptide maturation radical SAM protein 1
MVKISFINMPFVRIDFPDYGLTKLSFVLKERFKEDQLSIETHYLQHDFAAYIGVDFYEELHRYPASEWMFRKCAFPDAPDNTDQFIDYSLPVGHPLREYFIQQVLKKLEKLDDFLQQLISKYNLDQADIVGFASSHHQNIASFALARKLKEYNPEIITVMGGLNCDYPMGHEVVKSLQQFDYVFSGPAMITFPQFVQHILDGKRDSVTELKGVLSKEMNSLNNSNNISACMGVEDDINSTITLDYDSFLDSYERHFPDSKHKPILMFEASRGCTWSQCKFCITGGNIEYRQMSPGNAIKMIESLYKYQDRIDCLLAIDLEIPENYPQDVFSNLNIPKDLKMLYSVRADFSEDDFKNLYKGGVRYLLMGIEALSTAALEAMDKGTNVFQNILALMYGLKLNIKIVWYVLTTFPGLTEEIYQKYNDDFSLLFHLQPPSAISPIVYQSSSVYYKKAEELGLDLQPDDVYSYVLNFNNDVVNNLAYTFVDSSEREYKDLGQKWSSILSEKLILWKTRFFNKDGLLPAKLYFKHKGEVAVVYDSRTGSPIEHNLSGLGLEILKNIENPKRIKEITLSENVSQDDIFVEIASLKENGLVFCDDDKYMSIVLPEESEQISEYLPVS